MDLAHVALEYLELDIIRFPDMTKLVTRYNELTRAFAAMNEPVKPAFQRAALFHAMQSAPQPRVQTLCTDTN